MSNRYEVVGAIDKLAAESIDGPEGDTIFVDDGDDELLIAQPKQGGDADE